VPYCFDITVCYRLGLEIMENAQAAGDSLDLMAANQPEKEASIKHKTYDLPSIDIWILREVLQDITIVHPWANHVSVQINQPHSRSKRPNNIRAWTILEANTIER
jgi:hypothetical protein